MAVLRKPKDVATKGASPRDHSARSVRQRAIQLIVSV